MENKLRIAIIGYGSMGKEVEKQALSRGHEIKTIIDPGFKENENREINDINMKDIDICIDFSTPAAVLMNVTKMLHYNKKIVMGTTGWEKDAAEIKKLVLDRSGTMISAPNFSLGVNLFYRMIRYASEIINKQPQYDIASYEIHHNHKKDSPSGTAKEIANILLKNISRKKKAVYDKLDRTIEKDEMHVSSLRIGETPGIHSVIFDSMFDTIELKHVARSRSDLALGAVVAAEWAANKKGFFKIDDMIDDIL
jgi:4-hydroxy-tetrahydrodipicolinate reductase